MAYETEFYERKIIWHDCIFLKQGRCDILQFYISLCEYFITNQISFAELEKRIAALLGKEAALLVPSGTMANLICGQYRLCVLPLPTTFLFRFDLGICVFVNSKWGDQMNYNWFISLPLIFTSCGLAHYFWMK